MTRTIVLCVPRCIHVLSHDYVRHTILILRAGADDEEREKCFPWIIGSLPLAHFIIFFNSAHILFFFQVLGCDQGSLHPLSHCSHRGPDDPADLGHLGAGFAAALARLEGRGVREEGQRAQDVPGELYIPTYR